MHYDTRTRDNAVHILHVVMQLAECFCVCDGHFDIHVGHSCAGSINFLIKTENCSDAGWCCVNARHCWEHHVQYHDYAGGATATSRAGPDRCRITDWDLHLQVMP